MIGPLVLLGGASTVSGAVDALFAVITANAILFSLLIFVALGVLVWRYRQGARVDRSHAPTHSDMVELVWTVIPLIIVLGMFVWNAFLYLHMKRIPPNALDIHVVGKQWMWKMQQPTGRWENNELHIPVGRPIKLTMASEDVIHAFYIPAFRVKMDVFPAQFTTMWFEATRPGEFHLFCAEFCGTDHSKMVGTVYAMEPAEYEKWLREGSNQATSVQEGARLFRRYGCGGCHGAGSMVRAPALEGIYGRPVPVQIPKPGVPLDQINATTVLADTRYLHDAILLPEREVAGGFRPVMPSFKNHLTEEEVFKLIAYIRTLSADNPAEARKRDITNSLTEEDYKARTGFVPDNVKKMLGESGGTR